MAGRRIIWATRAVKDKEAILNFWFHHNKSKAYSEKLNDAFNDLFKLLAYQPGIGKILDRERRIFFITLKSYRIYYSFTSEALFILSIWDTRRNPENLKI